MNDPSITRINTEMGPAAQRELKPDEELRDDINFVRNSIRLDLSCLLDDRSDITKLSLRLSARIRSAKAALLTGPAPDPELIQAINRLEERIKERRSRSNSDAGPSPHGARGYTNRSRRRHPALAGAR